MTVQTIAAPDAFRACQQDESIRLLDVRSPAEFEQLHARGARSIPLDMLNGDATAELVACGKPIYVICKSGGRSAMAAERLEAAGCKTVFSVEGGTSAWEKAGLPIVQGSRRTISIERQVRIAAGTLVLLGVMLGWWVHAAFFGISAFVGAGLVFAGITDWCGMGLMMAKLPWNR